MKNEERPFGRSPLGELVVNYHLIDACNFGCHYCYAHWPRPPALEIRKSPQRLERLIVNVAEYFSPFEPSNILATTYSWDSLRLSLAGGEPFLAAELGDTVRLGRINGMQVSIISNGSRISDDFIRDFGPYVSWLGLSVDAPDTATSLLMGRADRRGNTTDLVRLSEIIRRLRTVNPSIKIKINTVVTDVNASVDLRPFLAAVQPERWKVLRALPVHHGPTVEDDAFIGFLERHRDVPGMAIEDNKAMIGTYIMIDPWGRFFQNSDSGAGSGYRFSDPILEVGVAEAFAQIHFDPAGFADRYKHDVPA
jgi:radical S-adenosyl methionine domain-containing protein 2